MEVFFLDVAQGTCQVILLGGRRAIVVDCGIRRDKIVLQFLQRMKVESIDCLIISHGHEDHIGGAVGVLDAYQDRIAKFYCVRDHLLLSSVFWKRLRALCDSEKIASDRICRIETLDRGLPKQIWDDPAIAAQLLIYSPTFPENMVADEDETPNPTSGVLILDVRGMRLIFAADSEVGQWREIHRKAGKLNCDVLGVPHHAGRFHSDAADLKWFFDESISATVAVISAGTSNTHKHPRTDVVSAMKGQGTSILCTQFTPQCNGNDRNLEFLRPGILRPQVHLGRSSPIEDLTDAGYSRNVACAGTVRVEITSNGLNVDRLTEHQKAVDALAARSSHCPLCR